MSVHGPLRTQSAPKDPKCPANGKEQAVGAHEPRLVLVPCGEFEGQDGGLRTFGVAPRLVGQEAPQIELLAAGGGPHLDRGGSVGCVVWWCVGGGVVWCWVDWEVVWWGVDGRLEAVVDAVLVRLCFPPTINGPILWIPPLVSKRNPKRETEPVKNQIRNGPRVPTKGNPQNDSFTQGTLSQTRHASCLCTSE